MSIADGGDLVPCQRRSYDRGARIEDPAHVRALVDAKHAAHQHSANCRLAYASPASQTILNRTAENGADLGAITAALIRLLDRYGAASLQDAILDALLRDVPHNAAVGLALERQRTQQGGRKAAVSQAGTLADILYVLDTPAGEERRNVAVPKDDRP